MILDILFPTSCVFCSKVGEYLCKECKNSLHVSLPFCFYCKKLHSRFLVHSECKEYLPVTFVYVQWIENMDSAVIHNLVLNNSAYSIYKKLISLVQSKNVKSIFREYELQPLKDMNVEANKRLVSEIKKFYKLENRCSDRLFLVGYQCESVTYIEDQARKILTNNPDMNIGVFLMFSSFNRTTLSPQ